MAARVRVRVICDADAGAIGDQPRDSCLSRSSCNACSALASASQPRKIARTTNARSPDMQANLVVTRSFGQPVLVLERPPSLSFIHQRGPSTSSLQAITGVPGPRYLIAWSTYRLTPKRVGAATLPRSEQPVEAYGKSLIDQTKGDNHAPYRAPIWGLLVVRRH